MIVLLLMHPQNTLSLPWARRRQFFHYASVLISVRHSWEKLLFRLQNTAIVLERIVRVVGQSLTFGVPRNYWSVLGILLYILKSRFSRFRSRNCLEYRIFQIPETFHAPFSKWCFQETDLEEIIEAWEMYSFSPLSRVGNCLKNLAWSSLNRWI